MMMVIMVMLEMSAWNPRSRSEERRSGQNLLSMIRRPPIISDTDSSEMNISSSLEPSLPHTAATCNPKPIVWTGSVQATVMKLSLI